MTDFCAVHQCLSDSTDKDRKFFPFPKSGPRCYKWVKLAGRSDLLKENNQTVHNSYKICDIHFSESNIIRNRLRKTAMPIFFLPVRDVYGTPMNKNDNSAISITELRKSFNLKTYQNKKRKISETSIQTEIPNEDKGEKVLETTMQTESINENKGESVFVLSINAPEILKDESDSNTMLLKEEQEIILQDVCSVHGSTSEDDMLSNNEKDPLEDIQNTNNQEDPLEDLQDTDTEEDPLDDLQNTDNQEDPLEGLQNTDNEEDPLDDLQNTDHEEYTNKLDYNEQYIEFVQGEEDDTKSAHELNSLQKSHSLKTRLLLNSQDCESSNEQSLKFAQGQEDKTKISYELDSIQKIDDLKTRLLIYSQECKSARKFLFFALNLFISSPSAYKIMKNTVCLPETKMLRNFKVSISSKLSSEVLQCLKSKFQHYRDQEKICVINAEIIPLKPNVYYNVLNDKIIGFHNINDVTTCEPALSVVILMLKGLSSNWKQVLGYSYLSACKHDLQIQDWIMNVISELQRIGLKVTAFTSKHNEYFSTLTSCMRIKFPNPFFVVNNEKIYYIYDTPQLMITVRDEFRFQRAIRYFDTESRTEVSPSWAAVKDLYMVDKDRSTRFVPKLNTEHIYPKNDKKKKVIYATQVFSQTVASAFHFYVENELLPKNCIETAKFIQLMNDVFDLCNSSTDDLKNPAKCDNCKPRILVEHLLHYLGTLSTCKETWALPKSTQVYNHLSSINALRLSLRGIICLIKDCDSKYGFKYMYTRHLNHEHIDNFIESFSKNLKDGKQLTVRQFETAFRKEFVLDLMNNSKCKKNVDDVDNLIKNVENLTVELVYEDSANSGMQHIKEVKSRKGSFSNICLSLLENCYEAHQCRDADFHILDNLEVFGKFIKVMDIELCLQLKSIISLEQMSDIGKKLYQSLSGLTFTSGCVCFPIEYLKKLYVRYKIYHLIKDNNDNFAKDPGACLKYAPIS